MNHRQLALLALSMLLPVVARAQDRPLFFPSKDVAVIYRLPGGDMGNGAQMIRLTYSDGGQRERLDYFRWVEAKYPFAALIVDRAANKLIAINGEAQTYAESPVGTFRTPDIRFSSPDMHYKRAGVAEVANMSCTDWQFQQFDKNSPGGVVCVTDDGLILRYTRDGVAQPIMEAIGVMYGAVPDGVFSAPPGFTRKPMPSGQ